MAIGSSRFEGGCKKARSFTLQLLAGRFFMAFTTIIILSFIGTSYIFGLYSGEIKTTLGYDQATLNLLSFFKDLGANVSVHTGLIMEVAPPWVILSLGAVVNFFGYFMIWLSVTHKIFRPPVWLMCLYITIGANSLGFANTGAIVPCIKNFPENRGVVIGILKSYIGLGGAVMAQLYHALYGNDTTADGVILLIAWLPALILLLFAFSVRVLKFAGHRQIKREKKFFNGILYISLALAGFILVMIIVQKQVEFSKTGYGMSCVVIMLLLVLPISLVFREELYNSSKAMLEMNSNTRAPSNTLSEVKVTPGRVLGGLISEHLLKYKWPRPACLTVILFTSCIAHLLIAFNAPYGLYIASVVMAFCFGAEVTYLYSIISELFGLKHYATLYNYGSLAGPLGSYIFSVRVAGHLYDKEGLRQLKVLEPTRKHGEELKCRGVKCYQLAYIIIAAATFFTALVSLILVARTRKFYKGDIYKKFQEDENNVTLRVGSGRKEEEIN
uniref:Nodulin-like domain-containing protein n=1 Tax=Chenopodium quinoa TaxID=63459 RepID=A0A803L6B8_CHEQI